MKFICALALILCGSISFGQKKETVPYVVLISFDGFRYDYVEKFHLANFKAFIEKGSSAKGLIPSFPSKTFPNHYTIVTGLYPGNHGLVDNHFYDPESRIIYGKKTKGSLTDSRFYGGTPLWQLAQQHGLKTASYFWIGSEVEIQGTRPTYFLKYNESVSDKNRIEQTLTWLKLPEKERPHFITLYFSFLDTQSHTTGPNSDEVKHAALRADSVLGVLVNRIRKTNLPVNIIVVSDHGMMELKHEESAFITLGKLINISDSSLVYVNGGTQAHFYTNKSDSLYNVLKRQESGNHFRIYKRDDFPAEWHYQCDRAGSLLLVAEPGYYIQPTSQSFTRGMSGNTIGNHGYDPYAVKEMQGIFYAQGPNIRKGKTLEPFTNIHIYPFIAKILGLTTPTIDGDVKVLEPIFVK